MKNLRTYVVGLAAFGLVAFALGFILSGGSVVLGNGGIYLKRNGATVEVRETISSVEQEAFTDGRYFNIDTAKLDETLGDSYWVSRIAEVRNHRSGEQGQVIIWRNGGGAPAGLALGRYNHRAHVSGDWEKGDAISILISKNAWFIPLRFWEITSP